MDTAFVATIKALLATYNPGNGAAPQLMPIPLISLLHNAGAWNALTNVPNLQQGVGKQGAAYKVSVAGSAELALGLNAWLVNDYAVFNPTVNRWERINGTTGEWTGGNRAPDATPLNLTDIQAAMAGSSLKMASGQATTVAASDTIVTGLATVVAVIAVLNDAPVAGCQFITADVGNQSGAPAAGSFLLKSWKSTATADTAQIAATTFTKKVNWIAIGT